MARFQELQVLEMYGFHHDNNNRTNNELPSEESEQTRLVIKSDALRPLASLRYLNLEHIRLLGSLSQGNRATPSVVPLDPESNDISVNLEMQYSTKKTKTLHRLVFLPPIDGDGEILPYKVYIEQQEKATMSTFTGLSNLEFIRMYQCGLREINWEMFDGLYNLNYLSLEGNKLLFIPDFAFLGAPNLRTLSLAHNQLLSLQSTSLAGLFELEKLDLSYNNFSHLSELSLPPFPKLQVADFTHNPIESVFASTFEIMNATSILLIGGTESALNIQPNSFLGLDNLQKLNIINIGIALLERELLRGMPKLRELQVSGIIESISFDAFLEVPKLENLKLSNCGINSISMDAFYGLYGLLYLDLSNNLLETLAPGMFDQQFSLSELLLSNNKLMRLPPGFLTNVPAKMVRLEGNPWHCSCAMKDWQPAIINRVKQRASLDFCQFNYDKGSMCNRTAYTDQYVYDKRVAPRCSSPPKYKNWGVFQVVRKELKCNSKQHIKMDRKAYLKKKYEDYEKSIKPSYTGIRPIFKYYPQKPFRHSSNISIISATNSSLNEQTTKLPHQTSTPFEKSTKLLNPILTTLKPSHDTNKLQDITMGNSTITTTSSDLVMDSVEKRNYTWDVTDATTSSTRDEPKKVNINITDILIKKKGEQQIDQLRERATVKDKMQKQHSSNSINEQQVPMKISKKAWKMEMERKRQEKLKRYQNQFEQNNYSNTI